MKLLKKTAAFMLIGLMTLGLAACGGESNTGSSEATTEGANISVEDSTQEALKESINIQDLNRPGIVVEDSKALNAAMTDIPSLTDLITAHYVLQDNDMDEYKSYQVIYYGNDTNVLKAIHVEEHYFKSAGFTEDLIKSLDLNDTYPGITDLDFVKVSYSDQGDCYCTITEYNQLDDPDHLDQLYDCGCKIEAMKGTGKVLAADAYKELLIDAGAVEQGILDIHSTYED